MKSFRNVLILLCAINFLALLSMIGGLYATGMVGKQTVYDLVYIFRGTHRAVATTALEDYERMRNENEVYAKMFAAEKGSGEVYSKSVESGVTEVMASQQETERGIAQRLDAHRKTIEEERARIQALMAKEQELREEIIRLKTDAVTKANAENTQIFNDITTGMDPEDVSRVVNRMFLDQGREGAERAVQWLRNWKRKFSSDVLTEMDPAARQVAVLMLEDEFASIPPEHIALKWQSEKMPLQEMVAHLRTMPISKALKVIRKLDRNAQDDIWEYFAPLQAAGGP